MFVLLSMLLVKLFGEMAENNTLVPHITVPGQLVMPLHADASVPADALVPTLAAVNVTLLEMLNV